MREKVIRLCLWIISKMSAKPTGFLALPYPHRRKVLEEYGKRFADHPRKISSTVTSLEAGPSYEATVTGEYGYVEYNGAGVQTVVVERQEYSPQYRQALAEINEFISSGAWKTPFELPQPLEARWQKSTTVKPRDPPLHGSRAREQQSRRFGRDSAYYHAID